MSNWFEKCYRQGFQNLGGDEALSKFNSKKLASYWKKVGAELVYLDVVHQQYVLYPSKVSLCEPVLRERNFIGEFVDECRKVGIRSGAYLTPFEHTSLSDGHPEYSQTKTDGSIHPGPDWAKETYWSCWNSPFLDKMCALLEECFNLYDFDAAFYDCLLSREGVCHCPACKKKFKNDTGHTLPSKHDLKDPVFREYLDWKRRSIAEACRRLVGAVRVRNSDVQVVVNTPAPWCGCD